MGPTIIARNYAETLLTLAQRDGGDSAVDAYGSALDGVAELLGLCRGLTGVATSRHGLGVPVELILADPPLPVPGRRYCRLGSRPPAPGGSVSVPPQRRARAT